MLTAPLFRTWVLQGVPKGDASISYVKSESVELAIEILHDGYLRPNVKISVTKGQTSQGQLLAYHARFVT